MDYHSAGLAANLSVNCEEEGWLPQFSAKSANWPAGKDICMPEHA